MAKDPAFLFYYQDFLVGTSFMTPTDVGHYILLLCYQAAKGHLPKNQLSNICRSHDISNEVLSKFSVDKNGLFFNERLEKEIEKRRLYSLSRSKNRSYKKKISKSYVKHMENENTNENEDEKEEKGVVRGGFKAPSLEDCIAAFGEKGYSPAEAGKFWNHYDARGWMMGKNRMKQWRSAVATWICQGKQFGTLEKLPPKKQEIKKPEEPHIFLSDDERKKLIKSALPTYGAA